MTELKFMALLIVTAVVFFGMGIGFEKTKDYPSTHYNNKASDDKALDIDTLIQDHNKQYSKMMEQCMQYHKEYECYGILNGRRR